MSGVELPPSPPYNNSFHSPGPHSTQHKPTKTQTQTPDSPPPSPKQTTNSPTHSSTPPSAIITSPLPPLTCELFLSVISFLPQTARPRLGLVNRAWYNLITNDPRLWPKLSVQLHYDQEDHIELWSARAGVGQDGQDGQGPGVRALELRVACQRTSRTPYGDCVSSETVVDRFNHLVATLDRPPDASDEVGGIHSLSVLSSPSTYATVWLLHRLAHSAHLALFRNIKVVNITGWLTDVWLDERALSLWPEIEELDLAFYSKTKVTSLMPAPHNWYFLEPEPKTLSQLSLDKLHSIRWNSLAVPSPFDVPLLPALTTLSLHNVTWEGYGLLLVIRLARHSLETIEIVNFDMREVDGEAAVQDYDKCVLVSDPDLVDDYEPSIADSDDEDSGVWTKPAPIVLSRLKKLTISGGRTPPLFGSLEVIEFGDDWNQFPTGEWIMPELEECSLRCLDLDFPDLIDQSVHPLRLLGQNTTKLRSLDLTSSSCTYFDMYHALKPSGTAIRSLSLADTLVNDQVLAHLPCLTPRLAELDVRQCAKVSITAVARLVEAIRERSDGLHRLERVRADWPDWGNAEFAALSWLLWHGIWVREEDDQEGLGPDAWKVMARRKWIREGKVDAGREEREERWKERLAMEQAEREAEERRKERMELVAQARAIKSARRTDEATEVHYKVAKDGSGMVRLLHPYQHEDLTTEAVAVDMSVVFDQPSSPPSSPPVDLDLVAPEEDDGRAGQLGVPERERPGSAMSVVEH